MYPWDNFNGFGRWWAELPYQNGFQANHIADFFENENLTFSQWLAWLRRWMWSLESRLGDDENRLVSVESRTIDPTDTNSIHWTNSGTWGVPKKEWSPQLNMFIWTYPDNTITLKANVKLSESSENRELKYKDESHPYTANNELREKEDGEYSPDQTNALNYLYQRTIEIQKEVDEIDKNTGGGDGGESGEKPSSNVRIGNFSEVATLGVGNASNADTGVNHVFFDTAKGLYFTSQKNSNKLYVTNKAGDLISIIELQVEQGHAIETITNIFLTFIQTSSFTGWYLEIGCSNESAYIFQIPWLSIQNAAGKVDKKFSVKEFNSLETYYNVIGSGNTWLSTTDYMSQKVILWNSVTGAFARTDRRNFWNAGQLEILKDSSQFIGQNSSASADFYGRIVAKGPDETIYIYSLDGKKMILDSTTQSSQVIEVATDTLSNGGFYGEGESVTRPALIGIQIFNQPRRQNDSANQFTLMTVPKPEVIPSNAANGKRPSYRVFALGNNASSLKAVLPNHEKAGMDSKELAYYKDTAGYGLAGFSFRGSFSFGGTGWNPIDGPDKQTNLNGILQGFNKGSYVILDNSQMSNWTFKQRLTYYRTGDATNSPFNQEVPVILERVVRLTADDAAIVGQWVVLDAQWITDNILNIINDMKGISHFVNAIYNDMKNSGGWSGTMDGGSMGNNRHLATGNINFFGGSADGGSFIRTNNGKTENDVTAGI